MRGYQPSIAEIIVEKAINIRVKSNQHNLPGQNVKVNHRPQNILNTGERTINPKIQTNQSI